MTRPRPPKTGIRFGTSSSLAVALRSRSEVGQRDQRSKATTNERDRDRTVTSDEEFRRAVARCFRRYQ